MSGESRALPVEEARGMANTRGLPIPFSSRRMKAEWLKKVAGELGVPVTAAATDLRLMLEGKLTEIGKQPANVQAQMEEGEGEGNPILSLLDGEGVFLQVELDPGREQSPEHETTDGIETAEPGDDTSRADSEVAELEQLRATLNRERAEQETRLRDQETRLRDQQTRLRDQQMELERVLRESETEVTRLRESTVPLEEAEDLRAQLEDQKAKVKNMWRVNCEQISMYHTECCSKDDEISALRARVVELEAGATVHSADARSVSTPTVHGTEVHEMRARGARIPRYVGTSPRSSVVLPLRGPEQKVGRRGKAPPVDSFSLENPEDRFEDWLPTLERAALWNGWSDEETLLQLAGHLRGKALQEWNLLTSDSKTSFKGAADALRQRLDPQNRVIAATDFRHANQTESEPVADYVRRIERLFQLAYGRDSLSAETRDTMLQSQLQGGLRYDLMKSPAVSGAQKYQQLCLAARQEEKRVAELKRRRHYNTQGSGPPQFHKKKQGDSPQGGPPAQQQSPSGMGRRCYLCDSPNHLARQCKEKKQESRPRPPTTYHKAPGAKCVQSEEKDGATPLEQAGDDPRQYLHSSDEEGAVKLVRVEDRGSKPCLASVQIQGVPAVGIVDTGADICIIGAELFKRVASVAHLRKKDFKDPDKTPHTYDGRPFKLHGRIRLDITFGDKTMNTPVYVKMDAPEPLLLSEGICRQLGIVSYHPSLGKEPTEQAVGSTTAAQLHTVRVSLVDSVRVPPLQSVIARLASESGEDFSGPVLLEPNASFTGPESDRLCFSETLVDGMSGYTQIVLSNPTGFTRCLDRGVWMGCASQATYVEPIQEVDPPARVNVVKSSPPEEVALRTKNLAACFQDEATRLTWQQRNQLFSLLCEYHEAFALSDGERGETEMVRLEIDTGDARPISQAPRRAPFALRQEIARQLIKMQSQGVIRPSSSNWASPIVLVKKERRNVAILCGLPRVEYNHKG